MSAIINPYPLPGGAGGIGAVLSPDLLDHLLTGAAAWNCLSDSPESQPSPGHRRLRQR